MLRKAPFHILRPLLISFGVISFVVCTLSHGPVRVEAQNRMQFSIVSERDGHVALGLALRKLNVSGTFMQSPAHPDDETNALFAMFTYGMGVRSIDLQNNRGDGGQNEIGPELFGEMAVLRTEELLAAHRLDGAEQYFTRAIDFGYSFDPNEVIAKWGRQDIVGDYVRLLRKLRPDVVLTMNIQGRGGDRAHEATTVLTREAFRAAGDPTKYPEQIREGLRPWQAKKLYFAGGFGGAGGQGRGAAPGDAGRGASASQAARLTPTATGTYDSLLGRTYADIGNDARGNHKCQGVGGMPPLAGARGGGRGGPGGGGYQLVDTTIAGQMDKEEGSMFDGIDTSLAGLAQYAGPNPPAALVAALVAISEQAKAAQAAFGVRDDAGTASPVETGLTAVRALRAQLPTLGLGDDARYEIDFRLQAKERDFQDAVLAAHGVTFDAVADDGLIIRGQPVRVSLAAVNHGASDVSVTSAALSGFDASGNCAAGTARKDAAYACSVDAHVPNDAKPTTPYFHDNYWKHPATQAIQIFDTGVPSGVAFAPSPFRANFRLKAGAVEVTKDIPVEFRYVGNVYFGDKRMELNVVPAYSVSVSPTLMVIPAPAAGGGAKPPEREVHVSVTNGTKGAAEATVSLELPSDWHATPANVRLSFAHEDESLSARFQVTLSAQAKAGVFTLRAKVVSPASTAAAFNSGYQVIEYPHIQRRQIIKPAETMVKVVDVKVTPGINVGYVNGVGDQVPPAIQQLGAKLAYIDQDELAWGDLSKHDVIVTGVRAYERRADLRAYNRRLLDYVERGGTVLVQYNKMEFNQAQYGPYPAQVSNNRVTDETAPVKVLAPADPVFNFPNKIGPATWANWVQERGLYYLGQKDAKYIDLVSMADQFPDNPGEKLGSLVEARYGKGRWFYVGLALWRQLPAGTDGAYQLLANLLSVPKAPAPAAATRPASAAK
jgi:hypothetical protein